VSIVFYFSTNADTMIATKALRDAGVAARMMPMPANVQSSANLCLSIDEAAEGSAVSAINSANVALGGVLR
jgi:hypothetical protein